MPGLLNGTHTHILPLQLEILVVGGGVAGLACAHSLCRAGHRVTVLEKDPDNTSKVSGGIRVPPNMYKILMEWGLEDELKKLVPCHQTTFYSMETGKLLGFLPMHAEVMAETGGAFSLMDHQSLKTILYKLATSSGATIRFNSTVKSVSANSSGASIELSDGQTMKGDLIIGADGSSSFVRLAIAHGGKLEDERKVPSGRSMYSMTVSAEKLRNDPDWAQLVDSPVWCIWMAERHCVFGYPMNGFNEYAIHADWPDDDLPEGLVECEEGWDVTIPTSSLDTSRYAEPIQRILAMSPTITRARFYERPHVIAGDDWVDETGRIVVIGDAAHPFLPYGIQGPAIAIEDASLLAGLLDPSLRPSLYAPPTGLSSLSKQWLPILTSAFQDLRQERCMMVYQNELGNGEFAIMPAGKERDERDRVIGMSLVMAGKEMGSEEREDMLRAQWDEISGIFAYSAKDAAEEWWRKWGNLYLVQDSPFHSPSPSPASSNHAAERMAGLSRHGPFSASGNKVFWDNLFSMSSISTTVHADA